MTAKQTSVFQETKQIKTKEPTNGRGSPESLQTLSKKHFCLAGTNLALIVSFSQSSAPYSCRYSREPGGKGAPALHYDHPADQPARAAPGGARRTEEACRLTDGKTKAANGVGASTAGTSNCISYFGVTVALNWV